MMLLTAVSFIIAEASAEGLINQTQSAFRDFIFKGWVQLIIAVALFAIWFFAIALQNNPFYAPIIKIMLGFVFVRFGIFDLCYNFSAGQKWNYYGTVKFYDRIMSKLGGFGWFLKIILGIMGVVFLMGIS